MNFTFKHSYSFAPEYAKPVAYFCMEYAIHQPLKTYAGGLGFLAGSHFRSAFELKQNIVGISILWKYGYYDQVRKGDQTMEVLFMRKVYGFFVKTDIKFTIKVSKHDVTVAVWYLPPEVFKTAPIFFLSTETDENDYLAKTICHKLYDPNPETRIAASILLGIGGARLLELLDWRPETYHLNETHALPLAYYLYAQYKNVEEVRKRLVYTNHTLEPSGSELTNLFLLEKMDFFCGVPLAEIRKISITKDDNLDHILTIMTLSSITNTVSKIHHNTLCEKLVKKEGAFNIISITNAQNFSYWSCGEMYKALWNNDDDDLQIKKRQLKRVLFEEIADQNGEIYNPDVLTIVFAKRFAGYKRAELLLNDMDRFHDLVSNREKPVQIVWAGKPHPMDFSAIASFDKIVNICNTYFNCSILTGYEMRLSRLLKQGADIWLNVPRLKHEASGTSGMSAAMNGAVNMSTPDGWFPEFAKHGINSFIIPSTISSLHDYQQDEADAKSLYDLLERTVIPLYYNRTSDWLDLVKNSMNDISFYFDSNRMVKEYYQNLYTVSLPIR